jgi:ATP-dependent Clp protease ATP-binding subunit ClpA
LGEDVILTVADKFLTELQSQLDERQVVIEVDEEARLWLVEKGYDATMGARPMERVIQEHIKKPLADMVLFGSLVKGGTAMVTVASDRAGLVIEADVEAEEPVEA